MRNDYTQRPRPAFRGGGMAKRGLGAALRGGGVAKRGMGVALKDGGKLSKLFKGKETRAEEMKEAKAIKSGKISPSEYAKGEAMEKKMKKGGRVKKKYGGKC